MPFYHSHFRDFDKPPRTAVITADVLYCLEQSKGRKSKIKGHKRERKRYECGWDVIDAIKDGEITAAITNYEYGKLRKRIGDVACNQFYDSMNEEGRARFFRIKMHEDLDGYIDLEPYDYLFKLNDNGNMHYANLTSIILSVELILPIMSHDVHIFKYQNAVNRIFKRRHREAISKARRNDELVPEMRIYDISDLDLLLRDFERMVGRTQKIRKS